MSDVGPFDHRPTLVDVARVARVSVATASNALTGTRRVGDTTRARVLKAVAELGYEPNQVARALVSRRSHTVGLIIPDVTNPFFAEVVRGVERAVGAQGYSLLVGDTDNDPAQEERYASMFIARRVDGVIVVPTSGSNVDTLHALLRSCPTVLADRTCVGWRGDSVTGDSSVGIRATVDHLVGLGHRRIGYVAGDLATSTARDRFEHFQAVLAEHGLKAHRVVKSSFTIESVRPLLEPFFTGANQPTAISAADDLLALAVLEAARDHGRSVPDDVSVTGYDDIAYAKLAWPPLTTVSLSAHDIGRHAAALLFEEHASRDVARTLRVQPSLVIRNSTARLST